MALDVGTGPGFPGIPLKILRPDLKMVLLEANHKKVAFLKVLLSRLGLKDLHALHGRWEAFPENPDPLCREKYTLITMRAVKLQTEHLTRFSARILATGGLFAWWAGPGENLQTADSSLLQEASMVFHGNFSYALPRASRPRQLFLWKKVL
jgi:16S rRNA (guanine527-N7)-methyltransferase